MPSTSPSRWSRQRRTYTRATRSASSLAARVAVISPLGIVDPFLPYGPRKGEQFWLVVFPRQIKSLRHVWSHPDFPEADQPAPLSLGRDVAIVARSQQRLQQIATETGLSYDRLMSAAAEWLDSGRQVDAFEEGCREYLDNSEEFWTHFEIVTGRVVEEGSRSSFISCCC
jgi:hypothetical protein